MKKFLYEIAIGQRQGFWISLLKILLWVLSLIYRLGSGTIVCLYQFGLVKRHQLPKPVISVGNITLGGVGKTPLVALIARMLKDKGLKPVILIRGYMGHCTDAESDEAALLRKTLEGVPVLVGSNRIKNANEFLKDKDCDVFLLDDGFQYWCLARDLDIVAIDTKNPWGNRCLIPRGILREPLRSLKRADLFILTKTDQGHDNTIKVKEQLTRINPDKMIVETIHEPLALLEMRRNEAKELLLIKGKDICSFCSIGNPGSFESTLKSLGCHLRKNFSFMDHHVYTPEDIQAISQYCRENKINTVITTEKDAVKVGDLLSNFGHEIAIYYLKIKATITSGEDEFRERLEHILQR